MGGGSLSAREWLVSHGAADLEETYLLLTIEGRSSSTVRIRDVRAVIRARSTPISDTRIRSPSGGDSEIQLLGLNLDDDSPVARELKIDPTYAVQIRPPFGAPYFSKRQATLVRDEIMTYSVLARGEATRRVRSRQFAEQSCDAAGIRVEREMAAPRATHHGSAAAIGGGSLRNRGCGVER